MIAEEVGLLLGLLLLRELERRQLRLDLRALPRFDLLLALSSIDCRLGTTIQRERLVFVGKVATDGLRVAVAFFV